MKQTEKLDEDYNHKRKTWFQIGWSKLGVNIKKKCLRAMISRKPFDLNSLLCEDSSFGEMMRDVYLWNKIFVFLS